MRARLVALLGLSRAEAVAVTAEAMKAEDATAGLATVTAILDELTRYLIAAHLPDIVRRPARAYGDRTMVQVLIDGDHEWLLESILRSFTLPR